jgi:hypothetical protein
LRATERRGRNAGAFSMTLTPRRTLSVEELQQTKHFETFD